MSAPHVFVPAVGVVSCVRWWAKLTGLDICALVAHVISMPEPPTINCNFGSRIFNIRRAVSVLDKL